MCQQVPLFVHYLLLFRIQQSVNRKRKELFQKSGYNLQAVILSAVVWQKFSCEDVNPGRKGGKGWGGWGKRLMSLYVHTAELKLMLSSWIKSLVPHYQVKLDFAYSKCFFEMSKNNFIS